MISTLLGVLALALVLGAPVPLCVVFAARYLRPLGTARSHFVLVAAVAWLSAQTFLAIALGVLTRLTLLHVVLAEALLLVAGLIALLRGRSGLGPLTAPWRPAGTAERVVLLGLAAVGTRLVYGILTTPIREGDSLFYHLPAVAHWYRTAGLGMLGWGDLDHYPYGWELLALLFVLPFDSDFAIGLAQLLAWLLLGLAVYCTGTLLGSRSLHALAAASLVMLQPLVLRHVVETLHVDLAFAAAFVTTVYLVLAYAARSLHWSLVLLSGAWLAGIKTSALPYLLFTLVVLALAVALIRATGGGRPDESRRLLEPQRPPAAAILVSLVVALTNAGFWYGRNAIDTGNPLGLVAVRLLGVSLLEGPIDAADLRRSTLAAVFDPFAGRDWAIILKQLAVQLGAPFLLLAAGSVVLLLVIVRTRGRLSPGMPSSALLVALLLAGSVALYLITPFTGDNGSHGWQVTPWVGQALRFALPATAIVAVAAALGATASARSDLLVTGMALGAGVLALRGGTGEVLALLGAMWLWMRCTQRLLRWPRRLAYGVLAVLVLAGGLWCRPVKEQRRARMFPVVQYVDRHVAAGERMGLLATSRAYLFFGSALHVDVALLPHGNQDEAEWVRWLRSDGIRFIGVGPVPEEWWLESKELAWLENRSGLFEKVHGGDHRREPVVYRLRRPAPG